MNKFKSIFSTSQTTLEKLDFIHVQNALAERTHTTVGREWALKISPKLSKTEIETSWQYLKEALEGTKLSLGGVSDIRPQLEAVNEGKVLEGKEILAIAFTLEAARSLKKAILNSERPALSTLAKNIHSFDNVLRQVHEQLNENGDVRDNATPKLRSIRKRLNPLRERIRERLRQVLERHKKEVQESFITVRRNRYVIPVQASQQSKISGIALDTSDSGATVFIEPQVIVPLNNELALLEFEERDEIRRILIALGQQLVYQEGLEKTLETLTKLDLIAASARLAKDWRLSEPNFNDKGLIALTSARHPLIKDCVPNSLKLDEQQRLLIISGPNAGGKTVLLKTLGLAVLMSHSGLFVAAAKPTLPYFETLLTDIGDEQSIEASLSTYAGHLNNLKQIIEKANSKILILIDELGSGTDPTEGAAISQAVVEKILASGAKGLINTHLAPLKIFASETEGIQNAAMQFDVENLCPKFELVLGQPGRSYALAIAKRIGLPTKLLEHAAEILGEESAELESLLENLEKARKKLQEKLTAAQVARDEAVNEAKLLRKQITTLKRQEQQVIAKAAEKADEMLQSTLKQATNLKKTAKTNKQKRGKALEELQELRRNVKEKTIPQEEKVNSLPIYKEGMTVFVPEYKAQGQIVAVQGDNLMVQLGLLKVQVSKKQVQLKDIPKQLKPITSIMPATKFDNELNLRGERAEAAIEKVYDFLLEAKSLKVQSVRILHGKGTGVLREAIRECLKKEAMIERFEDALPYDGGHGVTVAHLKL